MRRNEFNLILKSNETGTKRTEIDNIRTNHCHSKLIVNRLFFRSGHKIDQTISREAKKKYLKMLTEEEMLFEDAYVLDYLEEKDFSGTNRQLQVIIV